MEKALSVGINAYPQCPLSGCVNDVANVANMAVQHFQFDNANVRLLVDRNATTRNILEALQWLVDVQPGDRCLFHFSGHGVQVPTKDWKQEIDGLDEAIAPVDFTWEDDYLIRDKQLYKIFRGLPNDVRFGWISDSCLAGNTLIPLLDGTEKPISLMAQEKGSYWVYSTKSDGQVVPGKAHSARSTGNKRLLRVGLDNGETLECTEDHLLLMRDGTYRAAGTLMPGEKARKYSSVSAEPNNHQVVFVEDTGRVEPVYDLTVDDHHNFAVSAGIFVHNCHSGDLTRAMSPNVENARTIRSPLDVVWDVQVAKKRFQCVGMSPGNNVIDVHGKCVLNGMLDVGFVAGCRSDQTSADTVVNGVPCGALTYYLVRNLTKMPKETPLAQVVEATGQELATNGYSQRPQAEGQRKDRPFLG